MNENTNNDVARILKEYGVDNPHIERYGKIYKVYSKNGIFALKIISPSSGIDFVRNVQLLYQRGYNRIVPIFPTLDGRYAILEERSLYYLMPWLSNEDKEDRFAKHQKMFRELARLHTLSVKDIAVTSEARQDHYERTLEQWEREEEFLEEFLESCERKWYMSPFELMFCNYYQSIRQAVTFSKSKLEEWLEVSKEETKGRIVMIHGKVSIEHFLYDDRGYGYFTNFEDSKIASPIHDLLPFLVRRLHAQPGQYDDTIEWINTYFRYFPFRNDEKLLFLSYLAHPGSIFETVEDYYFRKSKKTELRFVKKFQREYWLMKNTEYVVMKMAPPPNPV